tara:strand:+ start:40560 stop:42707 length:2148 start_codon:yes stop_codon:yes gene_type:complete
MAILGKIRERSMFLIIIIALALFSFVLTGLFDANSPLFNKSTTIIGEVNGETITRENFAQLVDQQRTQTGNRTSQIQSVNTVWDNIVRENIYKTQLEKSGIVVGEKDVWDEIIRQPFVQNSPLFKNEAGLFDQEKLKEYIATLKDNAQDDEQSLTAWLGWLDYEKSIKSNLQLTTYSNLIKAGLGVTLKEGERYYFEQNTKMDVEYVNVPYNSISDSLITISDAEIEKYVKAHKEDYLSEPSVSLNYVKFDIKATPEDEAVIKNELSALINDREEENKAAKTMMTVVGFSNTTDNAGFFRENQSDTPLDTKFYTKSQLPQTIADTLVQLGVNNVYGPYKDGAFFKLSKITEISQLPDSVKARHILLPFLGSRSAGPTVTQTEAQVKKTADSLLTILKKDKSKFADFAQTLSVDTGSGAKGGDLGWYPYNQMVPEFRDFTFEGKTGDLGIVKTAFGFHIIEIEGQKNFQPVYKVATFSKNIVASENTENAIFQKAETFASDLSDNKVLATLAKERDYIAQPVFGLKALDEKVSTLGDQRPIVTWAFEKATKESDIKRFDIEGGYAVVQLTKKSKKGLAIGNSKSTIRTILLNKKKAAMIKERMTGATLADIAKEFNTTISSSKAVSLSSPVLPNVGRATDVVGALYLLEENKLYKNIEAQNGIFAVKIVKKELPAKLDNYQGFMKTIATSIQNKGSKAYEVLKKTADIEDNRAVFY